jgi:hypothetical protein
MTIQITTPSVIINNTSNCDLGEVLIELNLLKTKIIQLMALIDDLKLQVADLQAQTTDLKAAVDLEQQQIADLLATNATVVQGLNDQIAVLQTQLANSANPDQLQEVINGLITVKDSLATTKADIEGTV